jgi:hypothetical protein
MIGGAPGCKYSWWSSLLVPDCFLGSRASMSLVPKAVIGGATASLCLVVKLPHVGANVDKVACHLHQPMNCGRQRGHKVF